MAKPEAATSIQALMRPYAAAKCPFCDGAGCVKCGPEALDERFDALRCKHTRVLDTRHDGYWCPDCGEHWWRGKPPVGLRTDLGSIYDVAKACGFHFLNMTSRDDGLWLCEFFGPDYDDELDPPSGEGMTKEEAAARAFTAAMPLTPSPGKS